MMINKKIMLIIFLFILVVQSYSHEHYEKYSVAGIDDAEAFESLFLSLQKAINSNDVDGVADYVSFPLKVNCRDLSNTGRRFLIKNRSELKQKFDIVFTPRIKKAIRRQTIEGFFINFQGVRVGDGGEAWMGSAGIFVINSGRKCPRSVKTTSIY